VLEPVVGSARPDSVARAKLLDEPQSLKVGAVKTDKQINEGHGGAATCVSMNKHIFCGKGTVHTEIVSRVVRAEQESAL